MRLLLINLPRTGSTTLHTRLVEEYGGLGIFNPFDGTDRTKIIGRDKIVVKSGILYPEGLSYEGRVLFYVDLIKDFDKVILLSRRNNKAHLESWLHMRKHNKFTRELFNSQSNYTFNPDEYSDKDYRIGQKELDEWNNILTQISELTDTPITYYEDIFDENSQDRYRRENIKSLI